MRISPAGVRCFIAVALAVLSAAPLLAQSLPASLSGRWTGVSNNNVSQTFALERIEAKGESAFSARLTWWTANAACAVRDQPIAGQWRGGTLSFTARTACDVTFDVELARGDGGWRGRAVTSGGFESRLTAR